MTPSAPENSCHSHEAQRSVNPGLEGNLGQQDGFAPSFQPQSTAGEYQNEEQEGDAWEAVSAQGANSGRTRDQPGSRQIERQGVDRKTAGGVLGQEVARKMVPPRRTFLRVLEAKEGVAERPKTAASAQAAQPSHCHTETTPWSHKVEDRPSIKLAPAEAG